VYRCTMSKQSGPTEHRISHAMRCVSPRAPQPAATAAGQGLTLVDFLAQRMRFLWNRGCM